MTTSPAFGDHVLENTHQTGRPVGFGLIGAGSLARRCLAPAIHAARGADLVAVAARDRARASELAPDGRAYDDYRALLADDDVEVAYVALNNAGHVPWVLAALEAGKHVLCEKPLGLSEADVLTLTAAAQDAGRLLVEAFWYRWHPRTLWLERLLQANELGEIRRVQAEFSFNGAAAADPAREYRYDPAPGAGGGALYDVGCYALSFAHLCLGGELAVSSASAEIGSTGVDLSNHVQLRVPGADDTSDLRSGISGRDHQEAVVTGTGGTVSFAEPAFTSIFAPSQAFSGSGSGEVAIDFEGTDPYRLMVESLAARVRGEAGFLVDLEHSRQIARSTQAAFAAFARTPPA